MGSLTKLPFREVAFRVSTDFLEHLLANYPRNDFQVRLWDGRTWGADEPRFTLVLKHPGALRAMFLSPSELTLGEAYVYDDLDIEGDIEAAFDLADYLLGQGPSLGESLGLGERLQKLPADNRPHRDRQTANFWGSVHSRERDRQAISYHYDLPAEFYSLWLDRHMVYSCAYFATLEEDLDIAQERKLDHICKKLRLRRGDHLLDIGCGWGALIMHAAADYGVDAVGITLSAPQAELARRRICESGLNDRCRVEVWDYRDLDPSRQYDKIVSVGMFEHVGEALLPEYFRRARDLLRPGGVFLNHGIAYSAIYHRRGPSFTDRYVFVAVTGTRRLGFVLPVYPSQLRGCRQGTAPIKSRQLMTFHLLHGWNGTGRTMAVASAFDFEDSDLQTFDATFGITLNGYARVFVKTGSVQGLGNGGETTLDVEYSTALGNGAFELIYLVNNPSASNFTIEFNQIVTDNLADAVTLSWGLCEQQQLSGVIPQWDGILMQGAAQGQTWFVVSGDSGAFGCATSTKPSTTLAVFYPASSPFVTACGGTTLNLTSTGSIATETAWSGSGGGSSIVEPQPSWEFGSSFFTNGKRWTADYSMDADPNTGVAVFYFGKWHVFGGTSAVCPYSAGLAASISQYKGSRLGLFAARLNQIANSRHLYPIVLHDITSGNNGYYSAGPGWDPPTGWGSPDGYMLMLNF